MCAHSLIGRCVVVQQFSTACSNSVIDEHGNIADQFSAAAGISTTFLQRWPLSLILIRSL